MWSVHVVLVVFKHDANIDVHSTLLFRLISTPVQISLSADNMKCHLKANKISVIVSSASVRTFTVGHLMLIPCGTYCHFGLPDFIAGLQCMRFHNLVR
jgi:hypothetical protein